VQTAVFIMICIHVGFGVLVVIPCGVCCDSD